MVTQDIGRSVIFFQIWKLLTFYLIFTFNFIFCATVRCIFFFFEKGLQLVSSPQTLPGDFSKRFAMTFL